MENAFSCFSFDRQWREKGPESKSRLVGEMWGQHFVSRVQVYARALSYSVLIA